MPWIMGKLYLFKSNQADLQKSGFVIPIQESELKAWIKITPPDVYKQDTTLIYRNHTPAGFFILAEGKMEIQYASKKKPKKLLISHPSMIALPNIIVESPSLYLVKAMSHSKISFVPKSEFFKLHQEKNPILQGKVNFTLQST